MTSEILLRYLHFISIFFLVSALVAEHLLLKGQMTRSEIQRLAIVDAIYGISALLAVTAGLFLWFGVGKPSIFYTQNWIFHVKVTLVILMAILSIYPTVFFIKHRKGSSPEELVTIPRSVKMLVRLELTLVLLIPLFAVFMAKGVGYTGQ